MNPRLSPELGTQPLAWAPRLIEACGEAARLNPDAYVGHLNPDAYVGHLNPDAYMGHLNPEPYVGHLNPEPYVGHLNPDAYVGQPRLMVGGGEAAPHHPDSALGTPVKS